METQTQLEGRGLPSLWPFPCHRRQRRRCPRLHTAPPLFLSPPLPPLHAHAQRLTCRPLGSRRRPRRPRMRHSRRRSWSWDLTPHGRRPLLALLERPTHWVRPRPPWRPRHPRRRRPPTTSHLPLARSTRRVSSPTMASPLRSRSCQPGGFSQG